MSAQELTPAAPIKPHINATALEWVGKARAWLDRAKAAKAITSAEEHEQAMAARKMLGQAKRQIEDSRKEHGNPYRAAVESINTFFRGPTEDVDAAIKIQDRRIMAWESAERERLRQEEERLRREREAEARRIREEAQKLEAERQAKEEAALREAERLAAEGRVDQADEVLADAAQEIDQVVATEQALAAAAEIVEHAPVLAAPAASSGGLSRRVYYSAEVVDLRALVQAWLDGKVPPETIQANDKFINAIARAQTKGFAYPGCRLVETNKIGG